MCQLSFIWPISPSVHLYRSKTREMPIDFKGLKYNVLGRCEIEKIGTDYLTVFHVCEQFHSSINSGARFLFIPHSSTIFSVSFIIWLLKPDILDYETVSIINNFNIIYGLWLTRKKKSHNLISLLNVLALEVNPTVAS